MSHIQRRGDKKYRARYRGPDNRERSKTFTRKIDAERFLARVDNDRAKGVFVDPELGRLPLDQWAVRWARRRKLSTQAKDRRKLRVTDPKPDSAPVG
jgi:hypothetical protein